MQSDSRFIYILDPNLVSEPNAKWLSRNTEIPRSFLKRESDCYMLCAPYALLKPHIPQIAVHV